MTLQDGLSGHRSWRAVFCWLECGSTRGHAGCGTHNHRSVAGARLAGEGLPDKLPRGVSVGEW